MQQIIRVPFVYTHFTYRIIALVQGSLFRQELLYSLSSGQTYLFATRVKLVVYLPLSLEMFSEKE